jgi:hypothetical protein
MIISRGSPSECHSSSKILAASVIVPATGGRGFSRFSAQETLILFEVLGVATG